MSGVRVYSSPELSASGNCQPEDQRAEDHGFEGMSTCVKLLLKLVEDHNEACVKDAVDERKPQRVAGMMTIIEELKTRIQKSQSSLGRKAELRRCYTDVKGNAPCREKRPANEPAGADEKEKLRRQLSASLAARKSLEIMCTSLGKEKEIMAAELTKKVHEQCAMEELIGDLKAQNEMLVSKVNLCSSQHREKKETGNGNPALLERNKALSEQLLKSLDGYRSLKRKLKDLKEENARTSAVIDDTNADVQKGLERIRGLKEKLSAETDVKDEISALESLLEGLKLKVGKHKPKKNEALIKTKSESKLSKP